MFVEAPKFKPLAGMPPIATRFGRQGQVIEDAFFIGHIGTPSGMPIPRLTIILGLSSKEALRAIILRSSIGRGSTVAVGILNSQLKAGLYSVTYVCRWFSGLAKTTQSTRIPGILTCLAFKAPLSAILSTCTMTNPPEFFHCHSHRQTSSVTGSFSIVTLPSISAVVPRSIAI